MTAFSRSEDRRLSCLIPEEQLPAPDVLNEEQRQFATQRHNLIYAFLRDKRWDASEYYDIAAFGFLRAVRRYLTEPNLQRFAFSTIAWRSMTQSIAAFHRAESRRVETEQRYWQSRQAEQRDPMEELEARLILHDLATVSSKEQYQMASLRLQGYSVAETALAHGVSPKRVRRLLKEMYRVYLCLYRNSKTERRH